MCAAAGHASVPGAMSTDEVTGPPQAPAMRPDGHRDSRIRRGRPRRVARELGPATIGVLVVAQAILWTVARPGGESATSYFGQLLGAESVLLLSIGLVLISMLPVVEEYFDGI